MRALILITALMIFLSTAISAEREIFDIQVSVDDPGNDDDALVYGVFSAEEGGYGGMELIFYKDIYSYSIRAIENVSDFAMDPKRNIRTKEENILMIVDIFLKPERTNEDNIQLDGYMKTMLNTSKKGEPLFRLSNEPLEFVVPVNVDKNLMIDPGEPGRLIKLNLNVQSGQKKTRKVVQSNIDYGALYSLYNKDKSRFETTDEPCRLSFMPSAKADEMLCSHDRMFYLDDGDSLLYMVTYNLEDADQNDDGSVNLSFAVKRYYFLNPQRYFEMADNGVENRNIDYGGDERSIDCTKAINGKKRHVKAEINNGTVTFFQWDNIKFTDRDIVKNWDDIVAILRKIETTGEYSYLPPRSSIDDSGSDRTVAGFLNSPANYTGDKIVTTGYSKSITIQPWETAEIEIPFTRDNLLPFDGYEIIKLNKPDEYISGKSLKRR